MTRETPAESQISRDQDAEPGRGRALLDMARGARSQGLLLILILLVLIFSLASPYFFRLNNFLDMGSVAGILGIMAVAETLLLISGGIDISLGSVAAMSAIVLVILYQSGLDIWLAALVALLVGVGIGALNGSISVGLDIDPLVVTLGTLSIFQGLAFVLSGTRTLIIDSDSFAFIGRGELVGIPMPLVIFLVVFGVGLFIERRTTIGRSIYAIGGNLEAARNSGIRVDTIRVSLFIATGISGAVAGILVTSQLSSAAPQIGQSYLLAVITMVILGGTSLRGGRGSLVGTFIAVAILAVLQNGFTLLQWSAFAQSIVLGTFLILAVAIDQRTRLRRAR